MKVVLFCGGLGMRLREYSETIPKPMVNIGYRPILWHVMKYYAHYGHKDFILCLGYRADAIKNYFLNYNECTSNDFVLSGGGKKLQLFNSDIHDWRIVFADTGINSNIGQRLKAVEKYLEGEDEFLANYSDGLTDMPLPHAARALSCNPARLPAFSASGPTSAITWCLWRRGMAAWSRESMPSTTARYGSMVAFSFSRRRFSITSAKEKTS